MALVSLFAHGHLSAHPGTHEEIDRVSQLLAETPQDASLYLQRAQLFQRHGGLTEAEADIRKGRELAGDTPDLLILLARIRFEQQRVRPALVLLDEVLAQQPAIPAYLLRAEIRSTEGRHGAAARDYDRALALFARPFPAHPELLVKRARAYERAGEVDTALAGLEAGMRETGPLVTLQECALSIELKEERLDAALQRLAALLAAAPRKERWLVVRAEILESRGRKGEAVRDYAHAEREIDALPDSRRNVPAMQELRRKIRAAQARLGE